MGKSSFFKRLFYKLSTSPPTSTKEDSSAASNVGDVYSESDTIEGTSKLSNRRLSRSSLTRKQLAEAYSDSQKTAAVVRPRRLMKEFRDITNKTAGPERIFTVELCDDNLFEWKVNLHTIDKDCNLYAEMSEKGIESIELRLSFPQNFPFAPPFMHVTSPCIRNGYVLAGGAICMELLTPKGWSSAYTIEAIINQFAASLSKGKARLSKDSKGEAFNRKAAKETFNLLVYTHEKHGWSSHETN